MLSIRYASSDHFCDDPGCRLCHSHGAAEERLGHNRCQCCGEINPELFMIRHDLWRRATRGHDDLLLCWRCTEQALGRAIQADDLIDCPLNNANYPALMIAAARGIENALDRAAARHTGHWYEAAAA